MKMIERKRGYFGIGLYHPKNSTNIGVLWRSAYNFGASFIFVIGSRCGATDASNTVQAQRHIPLYVYQTFDEFSNSIPHGCRLVGIEQCDRSISLPTFEHPDQAAYLLGAEDHGISPKCFDYCTGGIVEIPSAHCINVSVAGSIVMYDRISRT